MFVDSRSSDTFVGNYTKTSMKTTLFGLLMVVGCISLNAQDSTTTGHITYDEVIDISDNRWVRNRPDLPNEMTRKWDLYFTPEQSFFTYKPEEQDDAFNTGGVSFRMMRWEPKDVYRLDFPSLYTQYTEFMGKPFLITDSLDMKEWRMTGKQGIVMGYPCIEAKKMVMDTVPVIAWFTPRIRVKTGPAEYVGLPGAVLFVDIDNGTRVFTATSINMGEVAQESPTMPEDGEEVTMDEYQAIVEEKTQQMRRRYGR